MRPRPSALVWSCSLFLRSAECANNAENGPLGSRKACAMTDERARLPQITSPVVRWRLPCGRLGEPGRRRPALVLAAAGWGRGDLAGAGWPGAGGCAGWPGRGAAAGSGCHRGGCGAVCGGPPGHHAGLAGDCPAAGLAGAVAADDRAAGGVDGAARAGAGPAGRARRRGRPPGWACWCFWPCSPWSTRCCVPRRSGGSARPVRWRGSRRARCCVRFPRLWLRPGWPPATCPPRPRRGWAETCWRWSPGLGPAVAGRRHPGQGAARCPAGQRRRDEFPGCLRPAGPVACRGGPGGGPVGEPRGG